MGVAAPRLAALLIAAVLSGAGAHAGAVPPDWVRYAPQEGGFEVLMPREPERRVTSRFSPFGRIVTHIDIARLADRLFVVNSTRLPRMAVWMGIESYVFENTRERLLRENRGEERSYEDWSRNGLPGKLLLFDSPPWGDRPAWSWRAEIFVVGDQLVVLLANVPADTPHAEIAPFFESVSFGP